MIHKPGSQPEATALWFDPQEYDTKQGCKYGGNREERGRDRRNEGGGGRGGGALRPSTYGVCRKAAHKKIQAHIKIDRKVVRKRW